MYSDETFYESVDSFSTNDLDTLDEMLNELKEKAPFINWSTHWHDYETLSEELTAYVTLDVPVDQSNEATEIYEMFNSGEDISGYIRMSKYPDIFVYVDNQWVLDRKIQDFISLFHYLDHVVSSAQNSPVLDTLLALAKTLSEIYEKAWKLPYGEYCSGIDYTNVEKLKIFSEEQLMKYYIDYRVDLLKISELINDIFDNIFGFGYFIEDVDVSQAEVGRDDL